MRNIDIALREQAIKFFYNDVKQMELQLCGVLFPSYREYIDMKIQYYKLAIETLEEDISNADDNYK